MGKTSKLIIIIVVSLLVGAAVGYVFGRADKENVNVPSFMYAKGRMTPEQFTTLYYDKNQGEFRMNSSSPGGLEATYYGVIALKTGFRQVVDQESLGLAADEMFEKIRSYYNPEGYYADGINDPIHTTRLATQIDIYYPQDLNQTINLAWLKSNSLANQDLEESKLDPEFQSNVLRIYRNIEQVGRDSEFAAVAPFYSDYYCNLPIPENVFDEEYLRMKFYQTDIVYYLVSTGYASSTTCLTPQVDEDYAARTAKISLKSLDSIDKLFWFYDLSSFYRAEFNKNEIIGKLAEFYSGGGFKEKLSDRGPSLKGMFYGLRLYSTLFGYLF